MQKTLDLLLALDPPSDDWELGTPPTPADFGIDASAANELLAIAKLEHFAELENDGDEDAYYDVATHAYRLLADMRDPAHIPVFLDLSDIYRGLPVSDAFSDDILSIVPQYGELAVAPTLEALNDQNRDEYIRLRCAVILDAIAGNDIARQPIMEGMTDYLAQKHFTRKLNAFFVSGLIAVKASSQIDAIRICYNAHLADITVNGDLENVEMLLGLRKSRTTEEPNWYELEESEHYLARKELLGPLEEDAGFAERFSYLLDLYRRDSTVHSLLGIEAFIIGVLLSPTFIPPSRYYPFIWDRQSSSDPYTPVWENEEDASFFMQGLMVIHNACVNGLGSGNYTLLTEVVPESELQEMIIPWLLWLNHGIAYWKDVSDPENIDIEIFELVSLSATIINAVLTSKESGKPANIAAHIKKLKKLLSSIFKMNKPRGSSSRPLSSEFGLGDDSYGSYSEPHHRDTPKISRNAPCPCGSGKKYKRCCMR